MSTLNATGDFPQITSSLYGCSSVDFAGAEPSHAVELGGVVRRAQSAANQIVQQLFVQPGDQTMSTRRIVQVFIADPDINVPLDDALLYKSEPKFTDATDQELYFEVPIVELLKAHNEKRKTWLDKDATRKAGKDIFLEAAKIRDLKMVVVNIAQF